MRTLLAILLVAGCAGSDADVIQARQLPEAVKEDAAAVARANNQFAVELYRELGRKGGNLFVSPFSITTALAMLDAGAAGHTDQELRATLHLEALGDRMHTAYGALLDSLEIGRDHGAYKLATANRLFGQTGAAFLPSFLDTTRVDYGAELMPVDFTTSAARDAINAWVADQTDDLIPELLAQPPAADTQLLIANAIVFKGTWANQFSTSKTADGSFRLASGGTAPVRMMHKEDKIALRFLDQGVVGVLPFRGKDLSMVVVLPNEASGLPALEAQLSADAIASWVDSTQAGGVSSEVALPRFKLTSELDLPETLGTLGIVDAFAPDRADLSGINGARNLYVGSAKHQATISVDEKGAEAAAATTIGIVPVSSPPTFIADRTFMFFIYDHVTGAILFLGRLEDPSSAQ